MSGSTVRGTSVCPALTDQRSARCGRRPPRPAPKSIAHRLRPLVRSTYASSAPLSARHLAHPRRERYIRVLLCRVPPRSHMGRKFFLSPPKKRISGENTSSRPSGQGKTTVCTRTPPAQPAAPLPGPWHMRTRTPLFAVMRISHLLYDSTTVRPAGDATCGRRTLRANTNMVIARRQTKRVRLQRDGGAMPPLRPDALLFSPWFGKAPP